MFLEGVSTPFSSATIMCTPNGVEASINILANRAIYDLKPKTAVQIFYRDWVPDKNNQLCWRLMFDGFICGFYKVDQAVEGKMVSLVCRDFRADIRRAPAAIAYSSDEELGVTQQMYSMNGVFNTIVVKGITPQEKDKQSKNDTKTDQKGSTPTATTTVASSPKSTNSAAPAANSNNTSDLPFAQAESVATADTNKKIKVEQTTASSSVNNVKKMDTREYGGILNPLADMLRYIAGTAYGPQVVQTNGKNHYVGTFGTVYHTDERGRAKCGFFLDALVRGMWTEAVGGTSVGQFINKRARVDKRFLIPSNRAGYNIWNRQSSGLEVGSYVLGNSRFSSLEAAIMRIAGLFGVRVYSCNTPTLINIGDDSSGKPNPSVKMIMDEQVRGFLVRDEGHHFGGKFILNETMLLPPLEFTAPPNCNIFFPTMYDRVVWQYDVDADATRGYYKQIDSLSVPDAGATLGTLGIQVPNALFDIYKDESKKDASNRTKPPLTLEERYGGVNVSYGSVEYNLAADDAAIGQINATFNKNKVFEIKMDFEKLKADAAAATSSSDQSIIPTEEVSEIEAAAMDSELQAKYSAIQKRRVNASDDELHNMSERAVNVSMKRHALLKFLNTKYAGRVATIDMSFNPYVMCGFPGMVIDDEEAGGTQASKSIIGMVQQVKHLIYISTDQAQISTSVVMNNIRFVDEATDIDKNGNPLYMKPTDKFKAVINPVNLLYKEQYFIPEPAARPEEHLNNKAYDLQHISGSGDYPYVKDILTLTENDMKSGESNTVYLDEEYEPQKIPRFYRDVLGHNEDSFMIGVNANGDKFVYDTIHEAVTELRKNRKELLYDYSSAMRFASRRICSASAFYQGILGLSVYTDVENKYVCNESSFNDTLIENEYYGVTTDFWNSADADNLRSSKGGMLSGPGDFSSILETMPITAFIKERRIAVKNYIEIASNTASGMLFSTPSGKG
jgi:hypothetical protein